MCELCAADTDCIGDCEIFPGWFLERAKRDGDFMKAEDFGFTRSNDPSFVFHTFPYPEPDKLAEKTSTEWREWYNKACEFGRELQQYEISFEAIYSFVAAAKEKGYDEDKEGGFVYWLFDYLGQYLKTQAITQ